MGFGCDTDAMINQVVPSLIYSCLSLYEAQDALSGDFSGISSVYSAVAMAKSGITTCIENVNSAKEWVIGKAVAFEKAEGDSQKVVEQLNAVKDLLTEKVKEVPRYNQLEYDSTRYGDSTVKSAGCGITSYAMVLSYLLDDDKITPDVLLADHEDYHRYKVEGGSAYGLFQNTAEEWGLSVETCWWGEAWQEGKVMEALKNGQPVIFNARKGSAFTEAGHYIVLYGLTDDGKILVRDPNGANYMGQGFLADGFKNGFDPDYFKGLSEQGAYFIFNAKKDMKKNTEGVTDTEYYQAEKQLKDYLENKQANIEAIDDLVEPNVTPTLEEPTLEEPAINEPTIEPITKPLTDAKPIQPIYKEETNDKGITTIPVHDKWDYGYLTAAKGVIDYKSADGKHMSETWCPLDVTQLVKNIQQYEHIYYEQKTREDGVQMYGPYVIVAADVKGRKECGGVNQDATYNYGDIVETSLGTGIVMDYCGRSNSTRKATNGEQTHFDIYTKWHDSGHYQKVGYSEEYVPRDEAPSKVKTVTYEQVSLDEKQEETPEIVDTNKDNLTNEKEVETNKQEEPLSVPEKETETTETNEPNDTKPETSADTTVNNKPEKVENNTTKPQTNNSTTGHISLGGQLVEKKDGINYSCFEKYSLKDKEKIVEAVKDGKHVIVTVQEKGQFFSSNVTLDRVTADGKIIVKGLIGKKEPQEMSMEQIEKLYSKHATCTVFNKEGETPTGETYDYLLQDGD